VAEGQVVFAQTKAGHQTRATSDYAVYERLPAQQVELTGHPWAQSEKYTITDASRLVWNADSDAVRAFGLYHVVTNRRLASNGPAAVTPPPRP